MSEASRDPEAAEPQIPASVAHGPAAGSMPVSEAGPSGQRGSRAPTSTRERIVRYLEPHRGGRFASLDGYRAVAAIGVLVFHVGGAPGSAITNDGTLMGGIVGNLGNSGVATFFLLSGFLLYRPYVDSHLRGTEPPGTLRFYRNRLLRIVPAFWIALTGWFLLVWPNLPSVRRMALTPENIATVYGFVQIYRPPFGFAALTTAWTLCIEVSFYLVLPGIAWVIRDVLGSRAHSVRNRLRVQLIGIGALISMGWIYRITIVGTYAVFPHATAQDGEHLWLPNFFDWFGLGMLLAVAISWRDLGKRLPTALRQLANTGWLSWTIAALIYLILVVIRQSAPDVASGANKETLAQVSIRMLLNGLAAFFFLLPGIVGTSDRSWVRLSLSSVVPAYLGTISYGIYLWHKVWLEWLVAGPDVRWSFWPLLAVVFTLTVVVASASWFLAERPLMRFKDSPRSRTPSDLPKAVPT